MLISFRKQENYGPLMMIMMQRGFGHGHGGRKKTTVEEREAKKHSSYINITYIKIYICLVFQMCVCVGFKHCAIQSDANEGMECAETSRPNKQRKCPKLSHKTARLLKNFVIGV